MVAMCIHERLLGATEEAGIVVGSFQAAFNLIKVLIAMMECICNT